MFIIVKTLHIRQLTLHFHGSEKRDFLTSSLVVAS